MAKVARFGSSEGSKAVGSPIRARYGTERSAEGVSQLISSLVIFVTTAQVIPVYDGQP
jgi:hypothetical protein